MNTSSFPVRESAIFSTAELISRILGLSFLARYVSEFGLASSGLFRTVMPLIGVAVAVGSVGVPQALTRLVSASEAHQRTRLYLDHLFTSIISTILSMVTTLAMLDGLVAGTELQQFDVADLLPLLRISVPLMLILCVSGTLRGVLLGLGSNLAPAVAQTLEASVRLLLVTPAAVEIAREFHLSGSEAGILIITCSEGSAALLLLVVFLTLLYTKRIPLEVRRINLRLRLRTWGTVIRMSVSPTAQSLLASAGYAVELPLAQHLLAQTYGAQTAETIIAEYAAVAIPLLCAPMFVTDGMATALLPAMTAQRAALGMEALRPSFYNIIRAVAMVALPSSAVLYLMSPVLSGWFGAVNAAALLCWLAPFTLPLYLQSPVASLIQAQGRSRALLLSSLYADVIRIITLYLFLGYWHMGLPGLLIGFIISVLAQTAVLLWTAARLTPVAVPWRTLSHSFLSSVVASAVLVFGLHFSPFPLRAHPITWMLLSTGCGGIFLTIAGEIAPRTLSHIPLFGSFAGRSAQALMNRIEQ